MQVSTREDEWTQNAYNLDLNKDRKRWNGLAGINGTVDSIKGRGIFRGAYLHRTIRYTFNQSIFHSLHKANPVAQHKKGPLSITSKLTIYSTRLETGGTTKGHSTTTLRNDEHFLS